VGGLDDKDISGHKGYSGQVGYGMGVWSGHLEGPSRLIRERKVGL